MDIIVRGVYCESLYILQHAAKTTNARINLV